jgi:putative NIF3 family GTP cyclohydrolase 1 type 2
LKRQKYKPYVEKVAVVAGGGDVPDLLQNVFDYGCDTLVTGTVENRWVAPHIQDANKKFHELNNKLEINLIGGTHYATERPAMKEVVRLFKKYEIPCNYIEDEELLNAI